MLDFQDLQDLQDLKFLRTFNIYRFEDFTISSLDKYLNADRLMVFEMNSEIISPFNRREIDRNKIAVISVAIENGSSTAPRSRASSTLAVRPLC